jgi:hypothetical protein
LLQVPRAKTSEVSAPTWASSLKPVSAEGWTLLPPFYSLAIPRK